MISIVLMMSCAQLCSTSVITQADDLGSGGLSLDLEVLATNLGSKDVEVRRKSVNALYIMKWGAAPAIPALTKALHDRDTHVRMMAAGCFRFFGPPAGDPSAAVPILTQLLNKDSDIEVRVMSAVSLRHLTWVDGKLTKQAVRMFVAALDEKDKYIRINAACALAILGEEGQKPFAIMSDFLADEELQGEAILALGDVGASALPTLEARLQDNDPRIRKAALGCFNRMIQEVRRRKQELPIKFVSPLEKALKDSESTIIVSAMFILAEIGPTAKQVLPQIGVFLKHPDWRVRKASARSLKNFGSAAKKYIPALNVALEDENFMVRREAEATIKAISEDEMHN